MPTLQNILVIENTMEHGLILKIVGLIIVIMGAILSYNPELFSNKAIPEDPFEATERRILWGLLMGVGLLVLFYHQIQPWLLTLVAIGIALTLGVLMARLIGIVLD